MTTVTRVVLTALMVFSAFATSGSTSAAVSNGADVKGVGGGWVGFIPPLYPPDQQTSRKYAHFSFSAHTGPNGDFGQASFSISDEFGYPLSLSANIDCVNVFAELPYRGAGWFSGLVTKVNDPTGTYFISPGDRVYFSIFDGGDPSGALPVDDFEAWYNLGVSCKLLNAYTEAPDVTEGNIVVNYN
jgi:hypothetical protein